MSKEQYQQKGGETMGAHEISENEQAALAEKTGALELLEKLKYDAPDTEDPYEADEWYRGVLQQIEEQFPNVKVSLRESMQEAIESEARSHNSSGGKHETDLQSAIGWNVVIRTPREQGIFDRHKELLEKEGEYHALAHESGFVIRIGYSGEDEGGGYNLYIIPESEETYNAVQRAWKGKPEFYGYGVFRLGYRRKDAQEAFETAVKAASQNSNPEAIEKEIAKIIEKIKPEEE